MSNDDEMDSDSWRRLHRLYLSDYDEEDIVLAERRFLSFEGIEDFSEVFANNIVIFSHAGFPLYNKIWNFI